MNLIRESIDAFLAESEFVYEEILPGSGSFIVHDFRTDGTPFITKVSVNYNGDWVDFGSAVVKRMRGTDEAIAKFSKRLLELNASRPLAKFAMNNIGGIILVADYPAHTHSERFLSDHLIDVRNAQSDDVPRLLAYGQECGLTFTF